MNYYNEFDPHAAAWLRQLIKSNLISDGVVDDRSITEVRPEDLHGFKQCHFFAGIGGWSYALRLAGVSDNEPLWTASLPCQPFSAAGKQLGKSDERHLLPHFIELVRQCKPNRIFGEQVPGAIRLGWFDDLYAEMEQENYAVGSCVLTAAGAGAYHIRQRLYWMAYSKNQRREFVENERCASVFRKMLQQEEPQPRLSNMGTTFSGLAYPMRSRQQGQGELGQSLHTAQNRDRKVDRVINVGDISNGDQVSRMGDSKHDGCVTESITTSNVQPSEEWGQDGQDISRQSEGASGRSYAASVSRRQNGCGEWDNPDWIYCRDNKYRPIKPSIKPLVNGVSERMVRGSDPSTQINADETQEARVMRLKGYGNAIVPQVAAEFISICMEI